MKLDRRQEFEFGSHYLYSSIGARDTAEIAKVVAQCVVQFTTEFTVWPVGYPDSGRHEVLSGNLAKRIEIMTNAWDFVYGWWESHHAELADYVMIGLLLNQGGTNILDQHDGIPARLFLTSDEYVGFQNCLAEQGLPADLYVPIASHS